MSSATAQEWMKWCLAARARAEKAEAEVARLRSLIEDVEADREVMTGAGERSSVSTMRWERLLATRAPCPPVKP